MSLFVNILHLLSLSLWWGAMVYFTFLATPTIFQGLSADGAARTVALLFPGYFWLGTIAGLVIFLTATYRFMAFPGLDGRMIVKWIFILSAIMLLLNLINQWLILPDMQSIQSQITTFEGPKEGNPLRMEFGKLHGISMVLNLTSIILGTISLGLSAKSMDRPTFF